MTNDDPMYVRQLEEARDAAELEIKVLEDQLRERDSLISTLEAQLQPPLHMGEPTIKVNYKWIVTWLLAEAKLNPFNPIGHWVEHGRCAEMLSEFAWQLHDEERAEGYWEAKQMGML